MVAEQIREGCPACILALAVALHLKIFLASTTIMTPDSYLASYG
jgi:hypothetical protein